MITTSQHTGFHVADLERSLVFYRDLLGLEVVATRVITEEYVGRLVGYPGVELRVAYLRTPGTEHVLELLEYRGAPRAPVDTRTPNPGTVHICFEVDDLMELYGRLRAAGFASMSEEPVVPTSGPNRGRLAVYMVDPDGIRVELVQ